MELPSRTHSVRDCVDSRQTQPLPFSSHITSQGYDFWQHPINPGKDCDPSQSVFRWAFVESPGGGGKPWAGMGHYLFRRASTSPPPLLPLLSLSRSTPSLTLPPPPQVMLLAVVLLGRSLEASARAQASSDLQALLVSRVGGVGEWGSGEI